MIKRLLYVVFVCLLSIASYAQEDTARLRVSLLTCGTGEESWETFGHTALRVTDSAAGIDDVYNYGTFSFDDDFVLKFMRGKLLYYVSYYPYSNFLDEYKYAKRSVKEQVLSVDNKTAWDIYNFLKENAKDENKYYKYDFFFDNCATRIRDVFPMALGKSFVFGKTVATTQKLSYRDVMNQYYYYKHWERIGVNILLGSMIDQRITNEGIMFVPDFLSDGIGKATVNNKPISAEPVLVLDGSPVHPAGTNWPMIVMVLIATLTVAGLSVKKLKWLGNIMQFLVLLVTGLLGCLILFMWLGTDHQGCQNNYNVLWALPLNLLLAFLPKKRKDKYALVAIVLLLLSLVLHVFNVQKMPLLELWPLLLSMLMIFGNIYRKNKRSANAGV